MKKETTWIWIAVGVLAFWVITRRYVWPALEGFQAAPPPCPSETIAGKKTWLCASDQAVVRLKSSGLAVADDQICVDNGDTSNRIFFCKDRSVSDPGMEDDVRFEMMDMYDSSCTKLIKAYTDLSGASDAKLREKNTIDSAAQEGIFSVAVMDDLYSKYGCATVAATSPMKRTCDAILQAKSSMSTSQGSIKTTQDAAFAPLLGMEQARLNGLRRLIELRCLNIKASDLTVPVSPWTPQFNGQFIKADGSSTAYFVSSKNSQAYAITNCVACPSITPNLCNLAKVVTQDQINTTRMASDPFTCSLLTDAIIAV
jgi:hypothetical protein